MFRISVAVLQKPDGSVKALYVGPEGEEAKAARDACEEEGEVGTLINVRAGSLKKNKASDQPAAKTASASAKTSKSNRS
jgi:hypothetical protein